MSDELLAAIVGAVIGVIGGAVASLAGTGLVLAAQGRERAEERVHADQEVADRTHQDFLESTLYLIRCYAVVSSRLLPLRPDGILDATARYLSALARVYALREPADVRAAVDKVAAAVTALQESFSRAWTLRALSIDPQRVEDVADAIGKLAVLRTEARDRPSPSRRRWQRLVVAVVVTDPAVGICVTRVRLMSNACWT